MLDATPTLQSLAAPLRALPSARPPRRRWLAACAPPVTRLVDPPPAINSACSSTAVGCACQCVQWRPVGCVRLAGASAGGAKPQLHARVCIGCSPHLLQHSGQSHAMLRRQPRLRQGGLQCRVQIVVRACRPRASALLLPTTAHTRLWSTHRQG